MKEINQMLYRWIKNSIIRAEVRKVIENHILDEKTEAFKAGWAKGSLEIINNKQNMKYITVLDFEVGKVFQYGWPGITNKHQDAGERCEEYLSEVGHNLNNCQWMIHDSNEIITK